MCCSAALCLVVVPGGGGLTHLLCFECFWGFHEQLICFTFHRKSPLQLQGCWASYWKLRYNLLHKNRLNWLSWASRVRFSGYTCTRPSENLKSNPLKTFLAQHYSCCDSVRESRAKLSRLQNFLSCLLQFEPKWIPSSSPPVTESYILSSVITLKELKPINIMINFILMRKSCTNSDVQLVGSVTAFCLQNLLQSSVLPLSRTVGTCRTLTLTWGIWLIFKNILCIYYVFMNVKQYSSSTCQRPRGDLWGCKNQRWKVTGVCLLYAVIFLLNLSARLQYLYYYNYYFPNVVKTTTM